MPRVVVSHCWEGSPAAGWYPDLAARLGAHGVEVVIPALPAPDAPEPGPWRRALADAIGAADGATVLVGHSLGAANVLRYLEAAGDDVRLAGVVLVAAFAEDPGIEPIRAFYAGGFDLARVRARARRFVSIHSDDDPYVRPEPLHHARILAAGLGATLTIIPGGRHFSPSTCTTLPDVAWRVRELLDPTS